MISDEGLEKALQDIEDLKKRVNALTEDLLVDTSALKKQLSELTQAVQIQGLELTRSLAAIRLDEQLDAVNSILGSNNASTALRQQAQLDATKCRTEIFHSDSPYGLVNEFIRTWQERFKTHHYEYTTH
jgi:hypothetical protein